MPNINVVLVDEHDNRVGTEEKLLAHQKGLLHRAFSVFVFSQVGDELSLLIQQRQHGKYHSGGLWTNTCCSHPYPDEDIIEAGQRRLQEEVGFSVPLTRVGAFVYRAECGGGLVEHEYDHVLIANVSPNTISPDPNPEEVMAVRWITLSGLNAELKKCPDDYTPWFVPALEIGLSAVQT